MMILSEIMISLNTCNWRLLHYLQMLTKDDLIRDQDISERMQLALYFLLRLLGLYSDFTRTNRELGLVKHFSFLLGLLRLYSDY